MQIISLIQFVCRWCGKESEIDKFRSRYPKICMDCYRNHIHKKTRGDNAKYLRLKYNAKKQGVDMDIPFAEYQRLQEEACHYCGLSVTGRSSVDSSENTGSGLDRIEPKQGYTLDNVVPSCFMCNRTKSDWFTHDEMKIIGQTLRQVLMFRGGQ